LVQPDFWDLLLAAAALMLVLEGLLPFINPASWRGIFERATRLGDGQIRFLGLVSIVLGLLMLSMFWE
jgi:uncharacterized protein YjeT (DUF2065 family)